MLDTMPLEGVRVLDLTRHTVGPFATRLLGDYGADVIKIEAPGGDPARMLPPFAGGEPGLERSGTFLFLNTNKRSMVLDLKSEDGRERFLQLARGADAVVENFRPGTMERLGLGYEVLAGLNPRIVVTSISNFGQDGPYRDWEGTDLTIYAMGGPMISTGDVDHEPLKVAGRWAGYQAGFVAALATAVGLWGARLRGEGEHLDVSILEALTHNIDGRLISLLQYQYTGRPAVRRPRAAGAGNGVFPCADGWCLLTGGGLANMSAFMRMIGQEQLLESPEWRDPGAFADPDRIEEFNAYVLGWSVMKTKAEVRDACEQFGVMGAPLNTVADMLTDKSLVYRKFFEEIDHPSTGPVQYPGYHFRLHGEHGPEMPPRRRAPLLGEHTDEVLAELEQARAAVVAPRAPSSARRDEAGYRPPLEGIRILDLTLVLAGPFATMHLADWGAEVIRIESLQHPQPFTRGMPFVRPTLDMVRRQMVPPYFPDDDPGERAWNKPANFTHHARGKKSMTLDLSRPEGQEVFERLVAQADGVIENNLPPHIEKLGITWERLSKINPRLVLLRQPAFGLDGPYRAYRTFGNHMEAIAAHPVIRAYPDLSLDYAPQGIPADAASGIAGAYAFLMGLYQRERTGKGVMLELASAENIIPFMGEFVMDYTLNGRSWEHMGNDHFFLAPHNVYRCADGDRWVAIVARNEDEWRRLCEVMRRPELANDPRFASMEARYANRRELDAAITEWTVLRDASWVMQRLQAEGIAAGVVMNDRDVLDDPQHRAREFFVEIEGPDTGRRQYVRRAWRASQTPWREMRHPVLLGEDNEYVYRQLLGFSDEEYRRFEELGHIGTEYPAGIP
ncbi:MAG: CoA transferase [Dehalococcoidia bacterium]